MSIIELHTSRSNFFIELGWKRSWNVSSYKKQIFIQYLILPVIKITTFGTFKIVRGEHKGAWRAACRSGARRCPVLL